MSKSVEIRHIDIRAPEPPVHTAGLACNVFWWGTLPLGMRMADAEQMPFGKGQLDSLAMEYLAEQLASREVGLGAPLRATHEGEPKKVLAFGPVREVEDLWDRAEALAEPRDGDGSQVSVVICTRDRLADLADCLAAIRSQIIPPKEIVVVDNSAAGSARDICAELGDVTYMHEPRPGLSIARNTGVKAATGEIIAFTDDDVEVHPRWVSEVANAFSDDAVEAMTGLVLPACLDTPAQRFFQFELGGFGERFVPVLFESKFFAETRPHGAQVWKIGAGANMAFRRSAFERAGWFDERLGAGASGCSEDSEFWYRLLALGGNCLYEPRAVVFHHHRAEWHELKAQIRTYMKGHVSALVAQYVAFGDRGNLQRIGGQLPAYFFRVLSRSMFSRSGRREMYLEQFKGWLSGLQYLVRWRWRHSRREAPPS